MSASISNNQPLTAAEQRAAARRKKILEQGDNRFKKILGLPTTESPNTQSNNEDDAQQNVNIASSSQSVTSGYTLTQRNTSGTSKVQERESTPEAAPTQGTKTTASPLTGNNESPSVLVNASRNLTELHRILLLMACAFVGSFIESNVMALFLATEPVLFILFFASSLRNKRENDLQRDQHLSHPNRSVKHVFSIIFSDLIVFLFAYIMVFALSRLHLL